MARAVTGLLKRWRSGDERALDELMSLLYDDLRGLARRRLASEHAGHTLQPTELVHEAFARLAEADVDWQSRAHFLAIAARTMRRVLVDHARQRSREKRGGGVAPITLDEQLLPGRDDAPALLDLDRALRRLASRDERKARVVELHLFGGLTYAETAEALGISEATVDRDLRMAKAWLASELAPESS